MIGPSRPTPAFSHTGGGQKQVTAIAEEMSRGVGMISWEGMWEGENAKRNGCGTSWQDFQNETPAVGRWEEA
jgi:hypothetical protein